MKGKIKSLALASPGSVLFGAYVYYEYNEYGSSFFAHFFSFTHFSSALFHLLITTTPFVSIALAYLIMERGRLISGLREAEEKYRDYYDNAPYGYHSADGDLNVLDVNSTWLEMFGYSEEEVAGVMNIRDMVSPRSEKKLEKVYGTFKEAGMLKDLELDFIRKDGSVLPVLLSSSAVFEDGRFVRSRTIVKDNSDRRTFEQILHGVAEHWENTFNSMPWGVMIIDARCNVLRFNEFFLISGGLSPAEIARTYCCDLINEPIGEMDPEEHIYGSEYQDDITGRHYNLTGRMIYSGEITNNYVFSVTDISDIKRGEKKLVDSRYAFFNMLKDASSAYSELDQAYRSMILSFANAIDAKSPWTKGHSERVSNYVSVLGEAIGLDRKSLERLRMAALLHDIGKIGTYDYLLEKDEKLSEEEYEVVKRHPVESARILRPIGKFRDLLDIVKYHHEHYDGSGYPDGLKGDDIPLMSRILCLADSYDSMIADRPYRMAQDKEYAIREVKVCSGTHFDPVLADRFVQLIDEGKV
jgi:PAS domain S-box-containing protein/putative nucleotidyltransferase with HDIG domain